MELLDLLGQRPDLLQQIFAAIFDRDAARVGALEASRGENPSPM